MAHAASKIPDPNTYRRVLRRYDRDPRHAHQIRFVGYDVSLRAVAAELDGKVAPTLFFPKGKDAAAQRATRVGWIDETEAWDAQIERREDPEWEVKQLAIIRNAVEAMSWNDIRSYAKAKGLNATGDRAELNERVIEWQGAQLKRD